MNVNIAEQLIRFALSLAFGAAAGLLYRLRGALSIAGDQRRIPPGDQRRTRPGDQRRIPPGDRGCARGERRTARGRVLRDAGLDLAYWLIVIPGFVWLIMAGCGGELRLYHLCGIGIGAMIPVIVMNTLRKL